MRRRARTIQMPSPVGEGGPRSAVDEEYERKRTPHPSRLRRDTFPHWGRLRCIVGAIAESSSFVRNLHSPPLCKGSVSRNASVPNEFPLRETSSPTEGLLQSHGTTPQACSTPAPLAQGSRNSNLRSIYISSSKFFERVWGNFFARKVSPLFLS